jgi:ABC-type transport system involved in multi-copper enzyme maturation permease subunit
MLEREMNTVFAIASVVIKELYRRKDFYVLFVLTAVITLLLGSASFFNDASIVSYLKDIASFLILVSTLVIAVVTTARQIPAERESRTIFPLLAKPVTRAQVVLGKFVGCWLACGLALVVFYLFFGAVCASREHQFPVLQYAEAMWLQWFMLGIVVALVLLGSVVFTAPSSNATICLIIVAGILALGKYLNTVALQQAEPVRSIIYTLYFFIPHLEWYDLREFVVYGHQMPAWVDCGLATLYAGVYSAFLLFATWVVFRRKTLSL